MSLPSPHLDDRTFQEIVDDSKRRIGLRCPEWTDHNVSDPGVTLIELFASMTEMMLYRLNQVPEKNYIKFLEMLGVTLEPPVPAQAELVFRLSRPIEDAESAPEHRLRAVETVAATMRTENEEAVEFVLDEDLRMARPRLAHAIALPAGREREDGTLENTGGRAVRAFPFDEVAMRRFEERNDGFPVYNDPPDTGPHPGDAGPEPLRLVGDRICFGFEADVSGHLIALDFNPVGAAATQQRSDRPLQAWEWWNGARRRWDPLPVEDGTGGFSRRGTVEALLPRGLERRMIEGQRAFWIRCRYLHPAELGAAGEVLEPYDRSPRIARVGARVLGGRATASNTVTVRRELLGHSDGTPGQVFTLRYRPLLPPEPRRGETLLVGELDENGDLADGHEAWRRVPDFSECKPDEPAFTCDTLTGEIALGPNVVEPDGAARQYGKVPRKGLSLFFSYRHGGGTSGNVRENRISILKTSIPFIASVTNPERARGGRDQESLEVAKMRAQRELRVRERAVTAEDFEFFAARISGVRRARCLPAGPLDPGAAPGAHTRPGVVRVLLVPELGSAVRVPLPADLRLRPDVVRAVRQDLDRRRLLTSLLEVGEPEYVFVSTDITLVAELSADPEQVRRRVQERLETFIHPLLGGPIPPGEKTGTGWPFGRALTLADLLAQIQQASGVAFLHGVRLYRSTVEDRERGLLGKEQLMGGSGIALEDHQMFCTREHRVRVLEMNRIELEDVAQEEA